jgi:hypothetical protein
MPQRTNSFQQLVALIQQAFAPVGAKVTESVLVNVAGTAKPREIDVLIKTSVGPYQIKIAVEAKDEGRKMDMTRFEAIIGKYLVEGDPKVNKIVVITQRGFTHPVIDRAKKLGVELLTLRQAINADWFKLYPQFVQLRIMPHICKIGVELIGSP